jgi:uncharacterized protein YndB with AHSA1/START domain/ribosomal protein S18 acetylase RimI-like enzyme
VTDNGFTVTRVFGAPRERVWREWTEPEPFADWFGGTECEVPLSSVSMDVRVGGAWRATMFCGPGRHEIAWTGAYREVDPPARLVFTISDRPDADRYELVIVELTDLGDGRTEMRMQQRGHMEPEQYERTKHGWGGFFARIDERPLAQRAVDGYAETLACLGRTGVGGAREVRVAGLVGARVPWAEDNHWIDAAVGSAAAELADPPHCIWTTADVESELEMPCMGLELAGWSAPREDPVEAPPLAVVGDLNDRAYGQEQRLASLIAAIDDPRVHTYGVRVDGTWACVAITLRLDGDASVQYVATDPRFRRRGLAAWVVGAALARARDDGLRTATLQASPDGYGVYERLGFRTVTTLHAVTRSAAGGER